MSRSSCEDAQRWAGVVIAVGLGWVIGSDVCEYVSMVAPYVDVILWGAYT